MPGAPEACSSGPKLEPSNLIAPRAWSSAMRSWVGCPSISIAAVYGGSISEAPHRSAGRVSNDSPRLALETRGRTPTTCCERVAGRKTNRCRARTQGQLAAVFSMSRIGIASRGEHGGRRAPGEPDQRTHEDCDDVTPARSRPPHGEESDHGCNRAESEYGHSGGRHGAQPRASLVRSGWGSRHSERPSIHVSSVLVATPVPPRGDSSVSLSTVEVPAMSRWAQG
jgi:hypothetical protein